MSDPNTPKDEEMHLIMRKLFNEGDSSLASNNPQCSSLGGSLPALPLVPYQSPVSFISKLVKTEIP